MKNDKRVDEGNRAKGPSSRSSIRPPPLVPPGPPKKGPPRSLPLLYLHGLSTGDFAPALEGFVGSAAGLSASVITRLTTAWQDEHRAFMARNLADRDYAYLWADGVHFNVRLEEERLCCLVIVGVRLDGKKELVAILDGYRGVHRLLGGLAERPASPRQARPSRRRRRRCARVLASAFETCSPRPKSSGVGFIM